MMALLQEEEGTVIFLPMVPGDDSLDAAAAMDLTEEISTPSKPSKNGETVKSLNHSEPAGLSTW